MNPYDIIYLLCNIFGTYTIYRFMHIFFSPRKKTAELLSYALYCMALDLLYLFLDVPAVNLICNLLMFFLLTYAYSSTLKTRLTATAYLSAILISIEAFAIIFYHIFLSGFWAGNEKAETVLLQLISKILSYIVVLVVSNFKTEKTKLPIPPPHWIAVFLIPIGSLVSTLLLMNQGSGKDSPQLFIIIAILILIDIFVFYLYDILQQYYQERLEKNLLIQQNNAYLKQLNMISQSQENMRLLRHDIKNHISVLRAFIETDSRDAALQYLDRALEETIGNANEFAKSGNAEIDSIINYKLYAAKQLGIEADVKLKVPQRLNIQPFDLVVILGNLLENAIEASSQLSENKKIDLSVHFDRNLLYIRIFNFYTGALWREGGKLRTTHKDAENHGLGLESVQTSVDKYNGTMKISYTWQTFCVDILLYNPNGEYLADGP